MKKIGFIGMGNMASAIALGCLKSGSIKEQDMLVYDIVKTKIQQIQEEFNICSVADEIELVKQSDIIVLAVKPNIVESVIIKVKDALANKAVVSIVAGYNFERYQALLLDSTRHLSIMPNTPALVNAGMTLLEKENNLTNEEFIYIQEIFNSIGTTEILPSYQMKAGGALSGCGPAFVYMMIEALADGAVREGLPREVAYRLASQTVIGAGLMQRETKLHPGILKDNVCSPGGLTIKGVAALEEHDFRAALMAAIKESI